MLLDQLVKKLPGILSYLKRRLDKSLDLLRENPIPLDIVIILSPPIQLVFLGYLPPEMVLRRHICNTMSKGSIGISPFGARIEQISPYCLLLKVRSYKLRSSRESIVRFPQVS